MLDVQVKELPVGAIAYVSGEANGETSGDLLRHLVDILETRPPRLVVVMDQVHFIDSRGLGALVGAYHRAVEQDCVFRVVSGDPHLQRVMQITGLSRVLGLCPTETEALQLAA